MSLFGPPKVDQLKARGHESGLIKAIGYQQDASIRCAAVEALATMPSQRSLEAICTALKDRDTDVCKAAISVLGTLADVRAIGPLVSVLSSHPRNQVLRSQVVDALKKIGNPAIGPLIAAVRNGTARRNTATSSLESSLLLVEMAEERDFPMLEYFPDMEPETIEKQRDEAENEIITILDVLGSLHDSDSAGSLAFLLEDPSPQVVKAAANAMSGMGWKPDRDETRIALYINSGQWRRVVDVGAPAIKPVLAALAGVNDQISSFPRVYNSRSELVSGDKFVELQEFKRNAIQTLGEIGDSTAVQPLLDEFHADLSLVDDEGLSSSIGRSGRRAAVALAELVLRKQITDNNQVVGPLLAALEKKRLSYQGGYAYGDDYGGHMGPVTLDPSKDRWEEWLDGADRVVVIKALGRLGDSKATEALVRDLRASDGEVILPDGNQHLLDWGSDWGKSEVRKVAAAALKKLGWKG